MYLSKKIRILETGDEGVAAGDGGSALLLLGENVGINHYSSESRGNFRDNF